MNKLRVKFISGYDDEGYNDYEWGVIDGYVNYDSHGIEPENCIFAIVATDNAFGAKASKAFFLFSLLMYSSLSLLISIN